LDRFAFQSWTVAGTYFQIWGGLEWKMVSIYGQVLFEGIMIQPFAAFLTGLPLSFLHNLN